MSAASVVSITTTAEQWRGPVLEVVQRLLRGRDHGREVLAVFRKLVARNGELELQLHELKSRRNKGEGVSTSQLLCIGSA